MERDTNQRQQVPPPFYGIYDDNDDGDHVGRLTLDDADALEAAAFSLVEAAQVECRARITVLEEQMDAICAEYEKRKDEIGAAAEFELKEVGQAMRNGKLTEEEAMRAKILIKNNLDDALNRATQDVNVAMELSEERNRIIRMTHSRIDGITEDLASVLVAYGWDPDEN